VTSLASFPVVVDDRMNPTLAICYDAAAAEDDPDAFVMAWRITRDGDWIQVYPLPEEEEEISNV
jgi:hypothetical protein